MFVVHKNILKSVKMPQKTSWYNILCLLLRIIFEIILSKKVMGQTDFKNYFFCSPKNIAIFQYDFRKLLGTLFLFSYQG